MTDENAIVRDALSTIRGELDARRIPLKVCAAKAGVSYSTFLSWFPAAGTPQVPSLACLPALARALPSDLLSLLVPDGFAIVKVPDGLDHDRIADAFADYLRAKNAAHDPESEAGRDIGPGENARLTAQIIRLPIEGKVA